MINDANKLNHEESANVKIALDTQNAEKRIAAAKSESELQKVKFEKAKVEAEVEHAKAVAAAKMENELAFCPDSVPVRSNVKPETIASESGDDLIGKIKKVVEKKLGDDGDVPKSVSMDINSGELSVKK